MENKNGSMAQDIDAGMGACGSCAVTRREALIMAAGATVLTLLPVFRAEAGTPDQWVKVGKPSDFTIGTPVQVSPVPPDVLFVTKIDDKNFVAVSAKCTHHGCQVAWTPADTQFECPCHGAAFTATGKNVHGTRRHPDEALPPLLSLPVRQHKGNVEVNLAGINVVDLQPNQ